MTLSPQDLLERLGAASAAIIIASMLALALGEAAWVIVDLIWPSAG